MKGLPLINLVNQNFMHNHGNSNNTGGHDSKMMWMMMLACLLPIIFLVFIGGGAGRSSIWWLLGAGAIMLGVHVFAMRGHGSHSHEDNTGAGTAGNQPAVPPAIAQADSSIQPQQPTAGPSATKDGHKHDCC